MATSSLEPLLEPLKRAVHDAPGIVRVSELPSGSRLDGPQLLEAVATQAAGLRRLGAGPGDCVIVRCRNRLEFPVAVLACWEANTCCILTDEDGSGSDFSRISDLFHPAAALGHPPPSISGTGSGRPALTAWKPDPGPGSAPPLPTDAAVIKLTSGTQDQPRGVVLTVSQVLAGAEQILQTMDIRPTDTNIAAIPMSHSYGFDNLLLPLAQRGSPLAVVSEARPATLTRALTMTGPCVFPGVPYLFDLLCRTNWSGRPAGLRLCLSAGAPLPVATLRAFRERHRLTIHPFYGSTETGGITFDPDEFAGAPEGCVGRPMAGVDVEFEPLEGMSFEFGGGRIAVRSPAVASRYWPDEGCPPLLAQGRFLTGDIGHLDAEGRLHLEGRVGFLANVAGRKVNPQEVERTLRSLPRIRDAVVIAVPDPRRGQALAACVESEESLDRRSLLEDLAARVARYKLPRQLVVVNDLPRTPRGKPDLARIRRLLAKQ